MNQFPLDQNPDSSGVRGWGVGCREESVLCKKSTLVNPLPPNTYTPHPALSALDYLRCSPETINPAIVTARHIQHLELSGQVTPEMMEQLAKEAQSALAHGKQAIADYNYSLQRLKSASPQPNCIPWGF